MATLDDNGGPRFRGKLGRTIYYYVQGVYTARQIGFTDKDPTIPQLASRLATKMTSALLSPVKPFINVGFEALGKQARTNQHSEAFRYNRTNAIIGEYPNIGVDFEKVRFAMGNMPAPEGVQVVLTDSGLSFSWEDEFKIPGVNWSDQAMMLAYFPTLGKARYLSAGASRYLGKDFLPLLGIERGHIAETYFSFIANDRLTVCNSVYTGQIQW